MPPINSFIYKENVRENMRENMRTVSTNKETTFVLPFIVTIVH